MKSNKNEEFLSQKILSGEITTYPQLHIFATMVGFDCNDIFEFLFSRIVINKFFKIFRDVITQHDYFDSYMTDEKIDSIIMKDGVSMVTLDSFQYSKFDSYSLLMDIDKRKPILLIRYFLNGNGTAYKKNGDTVCRIFEKTLHRNGLRMNLINDKKNIHERLKEKYHEMMNNMAFLK